ncbi:ABC-type branched-chain amino acid transport system, substrate-binding protein [Mucilaginibacter pineti]|uniref:ABC-type branched-chain amino acid transport system, substrate-binding protein n=1 Tax=Mucilaginibacter pineti TaxID=1391627 RepID=A0A1G7J700_9SPHI|nr:amino acid ABC transporter substrate-binding protein [Mucilaginibacter pineti]SDF20767.1 ABC-type branched-chain amino acid transport system, substrate-binding protein [Mucilaginibacter pineti]
MISAQNHLLQLSGNKWLLFFITVLILGACSPKLHPVSAPVKNADKPVEKPAEKAPAKKPEAKASVISLILPMGLEHLKPKSTYTSAGLTKANMSVEYYQGFKLALDSLAASGANFKLQLYDSKDEAATSHSLGFNPKIQSSDLIVGPVFPDGMKMFAAVLTNPKAPILSPLSPAAPANINSNNLITVIPPLEYHAWGAAEFIYNKIKPKKVFILRSGFSQEYDYVLSFKKAMDSLSNKKVKVIATIITRGQLAVLLPQLSKTDRNVFVVPATDQAFLGVTLRSLDTLNKHYPIVLFGHPSWEKFTFLKADVLQRLKTHITSTDKVNYKAENTIVFLRNYRKAYHVEPTDFAIKGFDEGLYFGRQMLDGTLTSIEKSDYTGLHNEFHFIKKPGLGWVNTHVNILMYTNFELKQVE